jgi:hypothetical protein
MVDSIDSLIRSHHAIIQYGFDQAIKVVKVQCTFACDLLVLELEQRFPYFIEDIVHLYMVWANSYPHGCLGRSHQKPLQSKTYHSIYILSLQYSPLTSH